MGDGVCLVVKVAETPEQKELRLSKEQSNSFFSSHDSFDDDITENTEVNPLLPRYNSLAQASPEKPKPALGSLLSDTKAPLGGAASLNANPGFDGQSPNQNHSTRTSKSPSVKSSSSSSRSNDYSPCHVCSLRTLNRCAECKTPYCSKACQRKDWSKHQSECKLIQHGVKSSSSDFSPVPRTPPPEESRGVFGGDSDDSFDELFAEEDEKLKALMATMHIVPNETVSQQPAVSDFADAIETPPSDQVTPDAVTPLIESEIFQPSKSAQYKEAKGLTLQEILSQFDVLPEPLPSIPLTSSDVPRECPIVITAYRDASHFSAVLATIEN